MVTIRIPNTLTVEEEEEADPADRYGDPARVIITVKFGDFEVAKYVLERLNDYDGIYYDGENNRRILYDTPEEFVAEKLKKLFALIN